ncbi:centrosomal protein 164 [Haematobia irritans]|uniref:centrosomal protein 164 n=1 Tax=Haematobia irritans TaxID=7368 RepID=UPI003F507C55
MAESISSTTSSSYRMDDAATSHSESIVCQGFYSDSSMQPTEEEIHEYAKTIGIDPAKEAHLLHLAKEGLMRPLPANWQLCAADEIGDPYYYNIKTNSTQREHPLNEYYRQLVRQERQRHNDFPLKVGMSTNKMEDRPHLASTPPTAVKGDIFGRNVHARNSVKAKASLWDQAFDEVYNKVIQQEKPKHEPARRLSVTTTTTTAEEAVEALETMSPPVKTRKDVNDSKEEETGEKDSDVQSPPSIGKNGKNKNASETSSSSSGQSVQANTTGAIPKLYGNSTPLSSTPSGFSGNVNRFLETRSKNFPKTFKAQGVGKIQKGFNIKAGNEKYPFPHQGDKELEEGLNDEGTGDRKGFTLSGTGAMFLKSRRHFGITSSEPPVNYKVVVEGEVGTPPGYKSILRETGLEEVKRRWQREFAKSDQRAISDTDIDDRKNVRFNLDEGRIPSSSEEELNAEMSSESEDVNDVDDPWGDEELDEFEDLEHDDDVEEVNDCVGIGTLPIEGVGYQRSLNPFLMNDERHLKEIKVTPVSKSQTIQMLKAQSFSIHMKAKDVEGDSNETTKDNENPIAVQYLEKFKESAGVKPSYEDTDSDSKGSSVHSIVVNKQEPSSMAHSPSNNPFQMDDNQTEIEQKPAQVVVQASEKPSVRSFKVASKLVGFLRKDPEKCEQPKDRDSDDNSFDLDKDRAVWISEDGYESECPGNNPFDLDELGRRHSRDVELLEKKLRMSKNERTTTRSFRVASKLVNLLKKDSEKVCATDNRQAIDAQEKAELRESLEKQKQTWLNEEREKLEELLQQEISQIKKDHEQKLRSIRHEYDLRLTSYRHQTEEAFELQLAEYRTQLEEEYDGKRKAIVDEHKSQMATVQKNHAEILEELERDLKSEEEMIKKEHVTKLQQMKDKLNDEMEAERQRMKESGEERLYEKVRCEKRLLEDKYRCLKEKYGRLKTEVKLSVERRNRRREAQALQQKNLHTTTTGSETERSTSHRPSPTVVSSEHRSTTTNQGSGQSSKPPVPNKTHLVNTSKETTPSTERNSERIASSGSRRPGASPKYARHLRVQDDTTSVSQSDTTISNNYPKGRYLLTPGSALSDNGNSDSEAFASNVENNNNSRRGSGAGPQAQQRKKQFTRLKSASTSRLNTDNIKNERPCTPVENLRHQLQKLEDLEDQLPDNALETTYHLRYPFSDISNADYAAGSSSELEFFKHRIHLERDSVRRAKESLRSQRTTFRARQREIKQRHNNLATRHSIEQLIQEEKDLTEMEVTLHRTRALLGEKVIRLRHLEQSVMRICDKAGNKASLDLLSVEPKEDATLSDLSSQSSSGFSSTDLASGDTQNLNKRREFHSLESNECIKNLEILNAEIREILDLLGRGGHQTGLNIPMIPPAELNWSHMMGSPGTGTTPISPTPDRRESYRKLSTGNTSTIDRMQNSIMAAKTIASQNPKAINYTNSLVERTRDIRNWLKQAKNEHELTSPKALGLTSPQQVSSGQLTPNNASGSEGGGGGGGSVGAGSVSPVGAVGQSPGNS